MTDSATTRDTITPEKRKSRIKSFVLRTGRKTPAQEKAFAAYWPKYGLSVTGETLDFARIFGNNRPVTLEIGFGMGDSLLQMAQENPDRNFVGIEVHTPGVGRLLNLIADAGIQNIRVLEHDAVEVLETCVADHSLSCVQIFFPDPWQKARHHKRRIIQPPFVDLLVQKLDKNGRIHLATDWENYAFHMMEVLSANRALHNLKDEGQFAERPEERPLTKFEKRGARLGHGVWDLIFAT